MMLSDTGYKTGGVFPWKEFLIVPPLPFFFNKKLIVLSTM